MTKTMTKYLDELIEKYDKQVRDFVEVTELIGLLEHIKEALWNVDKRHETK